MGKVREKESFERRKKRQRDKRNGKWSSGACKLQFDHCNRNKVEFFFSGKKRCKKKRKKYLEIKRTHKIDKDEAGKW